MYKLVLIFWLISNTKSNPLTQSDEYSYEIFGDEEYSASYSDETDDYIDNDANEELSRICTLPEELDFYGYGTASCDCDDIHMDRFEKPPCTLYSLKASYVMVCCPRKPIYTPQNFNEDGEHYFACDKQDPQPCPIGTKCVLGKQCGVKDFSNSTNSPQSCGYDESSGEDKICCGDFNGERVITPHYPKFPQQNWKEITEGTLVFLAEARPCMDHTKYCMDWIQKYPESCYPGHESYIFMREACQESCGRCESYGCVDNYENCESWSKLGHCSENPSFMFFNCRESCGTCGFKSTLNEEIQYRDMRIRGKEYTDISNPNFNCGEYRKKEMKNMDADFGIELGEYGICTNVIISDKYVITAAHCLQNFDLKEFTRTVKIRDGTVHEEKIGVKREWVHERRKHVKNDNGVYYDIAILELNRRIIFDFETYGDSPVCLNREKLLKDQLAITQGFGITETGLIPTNALETEVKVISNEECYDTLKTGNDLQMEQFRQSLYDGVNEQVLCTLGLLKTVNGEKFRTGPCEGDSGGPLYKIGWEFEDGSVTGRTLLGILRGGVGCGNPKLKDIPKWWMRVSSFVPWIECITEHAKHAHSSRNVERKCYKTIKKPFPPMCNHTSLFKDKPDSC